MIELYTAPTPNGYKASIGLEEMGLACNVHAIDFTTVGNDFETYGIAWLYRWGD